MTREKIDDIFTYHPLKDGQAAKYTAIREAAKALAHVIDESQPDSREKSAAITLLQNTTMMANAGIACNT